jgi:hypothetical protein
LLFCTIHIAISNTHKKYISYKLTKNFTELVRFATEDDPLLLEASLAFGLLDIDIFQDLVWQFALIGQNQILQNKSDPLSFSAANHGERCCKTDE